MPPSRESLTEGARHRDPRGVMPADLATPAIAPDPFKSDAMSVDVDFQDTLDQFPSEETLEIDSPLARHADGSSSAVSIGVDTLAGTQPFPAEPKLFIIVPAGPPVFGELAGEDEQIWTRVPVDPPRPDRPSIVARAVTSISLMVSSIAMASIRLARAAVPVASRGTTVIGAWCRAAVSQVAIGTAGVLRRVKGLAFAGLRRITSSTGVAARQARPGIVRTVRFPFALMQAAARAVRRIVASARLAVRSGCATVATGIAGSVRTIAHRSRAIARAWKSTIGISAAAAARSVQPLRSALAQPLRAVPRDETIRTRRLPIVALGHSRRGFASRLTSARYGIPAAALIVATVIATLVFVITPPKLPAVVRTSEPPLEIPAKAPPAVEPISEAPKKIVLAPSTTSRAEQPDRGSRPTPPPRPRPIDAAAIQRVLNRYRDAYSTLDVAAVRAIWPSVDAAALRTTFNRLAEHNVEYDSCKISAADAGAVAVCNGVAQSVPMGARTTTTEHRQWRFTLSPVENRWLIETVAAR
jgi:hypothetical protein